MKCVVTADSLSLQNICCTIWVWPLVSVPLENFLDKERKKKQQETGLFMYIKSSVSVFLLQHGVTTGLPGLCIMSQTGQDKPVNMVVFVSFSFPLLATFPPWQWLMNTVVPCLTAHPTPSSFNQWGAPRATWSAESLLLPDLKEEAVFCPFFCGRLHKGGNRWRVGGLLC